VAQKFRLFREVRLSPDWIFSVAYNRGWRDPDILEKQDIMSLGLG
jgi:hypothetical protein